MLLNKKGVSPLIATVLLVMIVVSIGAAVMVVIQGITEEGISSTQAQQQLIKCGTDVELGLISVGDSYRICIGEGEEADHYTMVVLLENKGLKDIADWRFTAIGDTINDTDGGFDSLSKGSINGFRFNFTVEGGMDSISKIRLSPKIPGGPTNPSVTCSEPNLEWDVSSIEGWQDCTLDTITWDDRYVDPRYD